jgi:hypothetical protein
MNERMDDQYTVLCTVSQYSPHAFISGDRLCVVRRRCGGVDAVNLHLSISVVCVSKVALLLHSWAK